MTLVGPGSWRAIRAATHVARTAVDLVVSGAPAAYALTRPPGHHATRSAYGGSCYLNNAAIAAQALREAAYARVAVIDIDAHHGNGTQAIFYERADVFTASVHVDPGAGWFPHHVGFADETGRDAGIGTNLNQTLAPGSGDEVWLSAVERAADVAGDFDATALVIALGVDAAIDDPESPLQVTVEGYRRAGKCLGVHCVFRPSWCRRAATICRHWASWSVRRSTGSGLASMTGCRATPAPDRPRHPDRPHPDRPRRPQPGDVGRLQRRVSSRSRGRFGG